MTDAREHWLSRLLTVRRARLPIIVVVGALLAFRATQVAVSVNGPAWGFDFSAYLLAGRHVLEGLPVYSDAQLGGPYSPQQQFLYIYPPFLAVAVTPLSALVADYRVAMWVWATGGVLALAGGLWAVASARVSQSAVVVLVGAALALPSVGFEIVMGNVHLLLGALIALAWLGIERRTRRGEILAGTMIGAAALIKIFPGLIVLWFILTRRWVAAVASGVAALLLVAATLPVVGIGPWLDYPRVLSHLAPPPELWSSLAPMSFLGEFIDFGSARVIVTTLGLALLIWSTRRQSTAISFSVSVVVSMLVVPTLYPHYLALLTVPLLMAVVYSGAAASLSFAYSALLIGGQLALIDLRPGPNRAMAALGVLTPLVALLITRGGHEEAGRDREGS